MRRVGLANCWQTHPNYGYDPPMSVTAMKHPETPSEFVAREVRAELGRQGLTQSDLARLMSQTPVWVGTRVGPRATVPLRIDEIVEMAEALNVSVQGLLVGLPRLDSNQQPSGYPSAQVRRCPHCGAPLFGGLHECSEYGGRVVDLHAHRRARTARALHRLAVAS